MTDSYMAWNGELYPSPPPEGWHQADDGRWWAAGTGPKATTKSDPKQSSNTQSAVGDTAAASTTIGEIDDADQQTILPGEGVSIPSITRSPERTGSWPVANRSEPSEQITSQATNHMRSPTVDTTPVPQPQAPKERRQTGEEVEALKASASAPPEQTDSAAKVASQETILPGDTSPQRQRPVGSIPKPVTRFNSTNAKGEPFDAGPPDPKARPKLQTVEKRSPLTPLLAGGFALVVLGGLVVWFFALRGGEDTQTTIPSSTTAVTTSTLAAETQVAGADDTTVVESSTPSPSLSTTTASDTDATTDADEGTDPTTVDGAVTPSSATVPPEQVVSNFREKLAGNGLSSVALTDNEIIKFGEDFCFIASNSKDRAVFDDEAQAAIEDSTSTLSNPELRLIIDTAVVVSCPGQAERLGITI